MQFVEQHIISKTDPRFAPLDHAAFISKNLYDATNYLVRQSYLFEHRYILTKPKAREWGHWNK